MNDLENFESHMQPESHLEKWLAYFAGIEGAERPEPESRVEAWLKYIAEYGGGSGGGEGGTSNYNQLSNKPKIGGVELSGNKTAAQLGLYSSKPNGIPLTDLADAVQALLELAGTALQEHQSLAAYRTASDQDAIDNAIQELIPEQLSQLTGDSTHRTVTDNQINTWNSGSTQLQAYSPVEFVIEFDDGTPTMTLHLIDDTSVVPGV